MTSTVRMAMKCRAYDLILDDEKADRHFTLILDFIRRGVVSPRAGGSGPLLDGNKVVPGMSQMVFFLAEEVADEYEREMGIVRNDAGDAAFPEGDDKP